jgi:hypothetical protein
LFDSPDFRSASSYARLSEPQHSVIPSWHEASKTLNLKSNTTLCKHTTIAYIYRIKGTHTDIHITQKMQEKLLYHILTNGNNACIFTMVFLSSLWLFSTLP